MNSGTDYKARMTDIAQPVMTTPVGGNQGGDYVVQPVEPYTLAIRGREGGADLEHRQDGTSNAILTPSGGRAGIGVGAVATFNDDGTARTLTARHDSSPCVDRGPDVVAYGFDWQSGGDCRGLDLKPTVQLQAHQTPASLSAMCVRRLTPSGGRAGIGVGAVAVQGPSIGRQDNAGPQGSGVDASGAMFTLTKADVHAVATAMRVRRLTPTECERLQGFPDGWTQVPYRNKPASDGPRYKAIGNSMAVPVMAWIGRRIAEVNSIISLKEAA